MDVPSSPSTVADTAFVGRIRSRVKNWRQSCLDSSSKTGGDGAFASVKTNFNMNLIFALSLQVFFEHDASVSFR